MSDKTKIEWADATWNVGGESGPNTSPMNADWARSLRDQCADGSGVAFLFKQWGDGSKWTDRQGDVWTYDGPDGLMSTPETTPFNRDHVERKWGPLKPVGKKAAGRELDGETWTEYPEDLF